MVGGGRQGRQIVPGVFSCGHQESYMHLKISNFFGEKYREQKNLAVFFWYLVKCDLSRYTLLYMCIFERYF